MREIRNGNDGWLFHDQNIKYQKISNENKKKKKVEKTQKK